MLTALVTENQHPTGPLRRAIQFSFRQDNALHDNRWFRRDVLDAGCIQDVPTVAAAEAAQTFEVPISRKIDGGGERGQGCRLTWNTRRSWASAACHDKQNQ